MSMGDGLSQRITEAKARTQDDSPAPLRDVLTICEGLLLLARNLEHRLDVALDAQVAMTERMHRLERGDGA